MVGSRGLTDGPWSESGWYAADGSAHDGAGPDETVTLLELSPDGTFTVSYLDGGSAGSSDHGTWQVQPDGVRITLTYAGNGERDGVIVLRVRDGSLIELVSDQPSTAELPGLSADDYLKLEPFGDGGLNDDGK